MRTPGQALMWELWRISRWDLIFRTATGAVFWAIALHFLRISSDGLEPIAGYAFLMLVGTSMLSTTWLGSFENKQTGFCFHLGFTRPISTRLLVVGPMIYVTSTSVLCFLIPATLLRWMFEIPFPLLSPSALIAAFSACFVAAAWSSENFATRTFNLTAVGMLFGGLVMWSTSQRDTNTPLLITAQDWPTIFDFTVWHYLALFLVFGSAVAATTFAVDRQRHGERLTWNQVSPVVRELADRLPRWTGPFNTPVEAQFWFEMRRSGFKVLAIGLAASVVAFLYIAYANVYSEPLRGQAAVMWLIALAVCPLVYQILGAEWLVSLKRRQGAVWLSTFDATQAIGSDTLIAVKLVVLATTVFASWLAMVIAAITQLALWGGFRGWARVSETISPLVADVSGPWWAVSAIVAVVLYASGSAMMIALGLWLPRYPKVFAVAAAVVFGHVLLAVWDARHAGVLLPLWTTYVWLVSAVLVAVCFVAVWKSLNWGCLDKRCFFVALCVWIAFSSAAVTLYVRIVPATVTIPLSALALLLGLLTVPLASVALAPLALASHRHR